MASLSSKIKQYCADNSVSSVDFTTDVLLQDDSNGQGPYIKEWNLDIAKPTDAQLTAADTAADLSERQSAVKATRKQAYGDIGSQLDMQYHGRQVPGLGMPWGRRRRSSNLTGFEITSVSGEPRKLRPLRHFRTRTCVWGGGAGAWTLYYL